ncbi:MAG: glycosyltransferase [Bryobacteraceae bacterium]
MTLDVVIPSYNRAKLLTQTLDSLLAAHRPEQLALKVFVVDNNSKDNTRNVVSAYQAKQALAIEYVFQPVQGRSAALNAGIQAGTGQLVAMLDDDEQVAVDWFHVLARMFEDSDLDFIGGPYLPHWTTDKPDWIGREFGGVVGWVENGEAEQQYGPGFNGMLMGGNAVVKRLALETAGPYNTSLGRTDKGLLSCEDEDMFHRLLTNNFRGMYVPDLVIYHYVSRERMTRQYHRRWCWGRGTSMGMLARTRTPEVVELFYIPHWRMRHAAAGLLGAIRGGLRLESPAIAFEGELRFWDLAGYINGRFFRKM